MPIKSDLSLVVVRLQLFKGSRIILQALSGDILVEDLSTELPITNSRVEGITAKFISSEYGEDGKLMILDAKGELFRLESGPSLVLKAIGTTTMPNTIEIVNVENGIRKFIEVGPYIIGAFDVLFCDDHKYLIYAIFQYFRTNIERNLSIRGGSEEDIPKIGVFNLDSHEMHEIQLPKSFLYPNHLVAIPNSLFAIGPAYAIVSIGSYAKVSSSLQISSVSRVGDPLRVVESVSNFISNENKSEHIFAISLNNGDLLICRFLLASKKLDVFKKSTLVPLNSILLLENGILVGCTPWKGIIYLPTGPNFPKYVDESFIMGPSIVMDMSTDQASNTFVAYNLAENTKIGLYREDIPILAEYRSDQIFRGATGLWMLRQYGMDRHYSMLVVSFVRSTILLQLDQGEMTDKSEFYGIDTHRKTLAIDNASSGSFLIQVCPDRILIFKSNISEFAGEVVAEWNNSNEMVDLKTVFVSAHIINDLVFAMDATNHRINIFQCRTGRGAANISSLCSFVISPESSAFTIHLLTEITPNSPGSTSPRITLIRMEYILACASREEIDFWRIHIEENSSKIDKVLTIPLNSATMVNEMHFLRGSFGSRLYLGFRNGIIRILQLSNFPGELTCQQIFSFGVGSRPVQLIQTTLTEYPYKLGILAISGKVSLITEVRENIFEVENVLQKADHLVRWVQKDDDVSSQYGSFKFVAVEHEALLVFSSSLRPTKRIIPWTSMINGRFLLTNLSYLVCISSPRKAFLEAPFLEISASMAPEILVYSRNEDELLYRTSLTSGDIITSAHLVNDNHIAIGMQIHDIGQLRILRIPQVVQKRRQTLPQTSSTTSLRGQHPQLVFACDAGFPHPVTGITSIGNDGSLLLVAAGPEIHLLKLNTIQEKIEFLRTEIWRSEINAISSNGKGLVALSSQMGGLELFAVDMNGNWTRRWSATRPDLVDRVIWCREDLIAATDRRGFIHFLQLQGTTVSKTTKMLDKDIPLALTPRLISNSLLVSGISGIIHEIHFPH